MSIAFDVHTKRRVCNRQCTYKNYDGGEGPMLFTQRQKPLGHIVKYLQFSIIILSIYVHICHYRRHTVTAPLAKDFASFNHHACNACKRIFQSNFVAADLYFPIQCSYNPVDPFRNEETRDTEDEQPSRNYRI